MIDGGQLDRRLRFERPVAATGFADAGKGSWQLFAEVWGQVRDVLPSRSEKVDDGLSIANRPARIRIRYLAGVTSDMRLTIGRNLKDADGNLIWHPDRVMEIVAGPAELGRKDGLELMAIDYSTAGNAA